MSEEVKPGVKTSEFHATWVTVLSMLFGTGGLIEFLAEKLDPTTILGMVVSALGAASAIVWRYIKSREAVKTAK